MAQQVAQLSQQITKEINKFKARVGAIGELVKTFNNKSNDLNGLKKYQKDLEDSQEDAEFRGRLAKMNGEDFLAYVNLINKIKVLIKEKWTSTLNMIGEWSKDVKFCREESREKNGAQKVVLDSKSVYVRISGMYSLKNSNPNIEKVLADIEGLGFPIPNTRLMFEGVQQAENDLRKCFGESSSKSRDTESKMMTMQAFLTKHAPECNFSQVASELKALTDFIKIVKDNSPTSLLTHWDDSLSISNRTVGEAITAMRDRETVLQNMPLPNVAEIKSLMSETAIIDLVLMTRPLDMASIIDRNARTLVKKPGGSLSIPDSMQIGKKKDDDRNKAAEAEAYKNMERAVDELNQAAATCASTVSYSTNITEAQRLLTIVVEKADAVSRVLTRYISQGSLSSMISGVVGSTVGEGGLANSLLSLWRSDGSSSMMMPMRESSLQGEVQPQIVRMAMYVTMVQQHMVSVSQVQLVQNIQNTRENTRMMVNELLERLKEDPNCDRRELRVTLENMLNAYMKTVKRLIKQYASRHIEFVVWTNRRALEYMTRWLSIMDEEVQRGAIAQRANLSQSPTGLNNSNSSKPGSSSPPTSAAGAPDNNTRSLVGPDQAKYITDYFAALREVSIDMDRTLQTAEAEALSYFGQAPYMGLLNEDEVMVERLQGKVESLEKTILQVRARLVRLYSPQGYSLMDILTNSPFIVVYIVKAIRVFFIWAALVFARAVFVARYNDAVYLQNRRPPNPIFFILIFLGFDLSLNIGVVAVMMMLRFILKSKTNSFPIDDHAIRAVIVDYFLSTALIAILGIILALIIRRKKYFRYRYEGERGLRALSDMMLWTSSIILIIPYFRFMEA